MLCLAHGIAATNSGTTNIRLYQNSQLKKFKSNKIDLRRQKNLEKKIRNHNFRNWLMWSSKQENNLTEHILCLVWLILSLMFDYRFLGVQGFVEIFNFMVIFGKLCNRYLGNLGKFDLVWFFCFALSFHFLFFPYSRHLSLSACFFWKKIVVHWK